MRHVYTSAGTLPFGLLSADKGDILWTLPQVRCAPLIVTDQEVLAGDPGTGLMCVEPTDGTVRWTGRVPVEGKMKVTVAGDRLVVQCDAEVHILDRNTGEGLFQAKHTGQHSALQDGLLCYHTAQNGPLVCVDVATGAEKWRALPRDPGVWSLHAAGKTVVVMAPGTVEGIDLETGAHLWWHASGPGVLFDTSTWASDEHAVYVHLPQETRGYALDGGQWVLRMKGNFFFVHWMRSLHDTLYLHSGSPNDESLGAIPLRRPVDPA